MELWLGPGHSGSAFESDEHRREVWFRYRDKLMRQWGKGGRRPQGWWWYESSQWGLHRYPTSKYERSVLWETPGVLTEAERAELEAEWRREWDRCWEDESFFHCSGPGKIFTGDEARAYHLVWADVPPALVNLWLAERERRGRGVRDLDLETLDLETEAANADAEGEAEPGPARA
jgi:hypothetical protein